MTPTEPTLPELPEGYRWFLKPNEDQMYVAIQREVGIAARRWENEYAEGGRGRMWDSTNPYCTNIK